MLNAILAQPNGAKFYRADLHAHTPADPHFHCGNHSLNTPADRLAFAREYVRFIREEQQLDIIAITDHNDVSWIETIRTAAQELYPNQLTVLPGIEIGANEGKRQVHFIALFPPDTAAEQLDHFISSLGLLPGSRFHDGATPTPRLTQLNTRQLTQKIVSADDNLPGLAIAAHATRKNGLISELEGEGRVLAYEDPHLIALEIPGAKKELANFARRLVNGQQNHYSHKSVACLNSSDGRGLGQTNEKGRLSVGDRATRIKLSTISIEALRHAFIDHDSRLRLDGEQNDQAYPRLLGLAIEGGFLRGETAESPLLIHFNPNLNAVIGGRGTGKSTLLTAVRFLFDAPPRSEHNRDQHEKTVAVTLPAGAKVTGYYQLANGTRYRLTRTAGKPPQIYDDHTNQQLHIHPTQLTPNGQPIEVYGQKEVYEIANVPQFQLNLLDGYIADQISHIEQEEKSHIRWLQKNAQEISHLEEEATEIEQQLSELSKLKLELKRLEQAVDVSQLARKKQFEAEKLEQQQIHQAAQARLDFVAHLSSQLERLTAPNAIATPPETAIFAPLAALIGQMDEQLAQHIHQLQTNLNDIWQAHTAVQTTWQTNYEANEAEYQAILRQHGQTHTLERFFRLQKQIRALAQKEHQNNEHQQRLHNLRQTRADKIASLEALRHHRFTLRQQKAANLTAVLQDNVRITLTPQGDHQAYKTFLRDLFNRTGLSRIIDKLLQSNLSPQQLAQAIRTERTAAPDHITPLRELGLTPTYRQKLTRLSDKKLYQLELFAIPDLPNIALKVGDVHRSLTPPKGTAGLSTGQKCTAILSLILVESHTPLLIDQPEDDLDNAFIFSEIVQTVRREKERRQFIIATHNANIPVSGDAELILLMEANEQHGWVAHRGSIDDPSLREPVENILEGGREAFRLRQIKYS